MGKSCLIYPLKIIKEKICKQNKTKQICLFLWNEKFNRRGRNSILTNPQDWSVSVGAIKVEML